MVYTGQLRSGDHLRTRGIGAKSGNIIENRRGQKINGIGQIADRRADLRGRPSDQVNGIKPNLTGCRSRNANGQFCQYAFARIWPAKHAQPIPR